MAIYKPPKLKNASEFLTNKKVNRSSPEEYYEVTSQKFSLYDPDTAYSGSQRAKQEKEAEKRSLLPKVNLQELRDNSINQFAEYLPQEEVSRLNKIAHQKDEPKQSLMEKLTSNVTEENRATLGIQKKPSAPRINSQVATLAGKQPEQYSQQQSAEGDRFLSDGNIKGQVASTEQKKESEPIDWENQLRGVGRSLVDLPRNIGAAAVNTYDNLRKSGILPGGAQKQKVLTEEEFNNSNALTKKGYGTYENYLKLVGGLNESPQFASSEKTDKVVGGLQEKLPSKVDSDTTLWEKMVRGAATSWLPSMASASLGGGLAGMAGQFSSNPIIIEAMRTAPLFTSGTDSGLKTAEELGLTGAKKYSYAVLSGLLEAGTERLSSLGLEGKLLGKKTSGGVGGTKEFLRAIFEESGSEMLNEVGQQLLTGQYTNYEDFELDFENIIVAGGSAALMGGFGAAGELSNGLKYRTVGTVDNQVIIETEDGRRENVNPEIVMRHQLANGRTARRAQELLKADAEIQDLAKNFTATEEVSNTIPLEDATTPQEALEVKTEPSMPIKEKPLTEPLNEQKEEVVQEEPKVIPPPETELQANGERLNNMIEKGLIDTKRKRDIAKSLNQKIVEQGGQDRLQEIEPQKVKVPKVQEVAEDTDIISSDDDLMVNNMAMEAEIEPMEQATKQEVESLTDFDLMDEYRESKTKQSMQNSKFSGRTKKIAENVDYFYKTVTFKGESLKSREQITGRVEAELARLETMDKESTRFTASDTSDAIMILELSDNLLNETGDAYWAGVIERAEVMRKKILSNFGQGLVMGKMTKPLSPRGTLIALGTDVSQFMTPAQKKGAEKINKEMTDILTDVATENGRIKLDATEIDSFVDTIMERFPNLKKNWGKEWKKQLAEGNATKAEILDSIYRASGVPRLSVEAKAEILEHLEAMAKLEEGSPEYNIHNNEIKSTIRWSRGIGFWTKLSALQTYAMLGNVKTGLKNELGNWIGFSMGQLDAEYSEIFDKQYAKTTGQRTVADRGKGIGYAKGYKEGFKQSAQDFKNKTDSRKSSSKYFDDNVGRVFKHQKGGYARILVDLVSGDNKIEAAKQFATHSAAKAENLTKFIVDDRRHAFARYEMSRAAIEVTDATIKETNKQLPKEQQIVFSKEEALANLEKEIAYYTFNNKTAGAKILTDAVKALNKFSTRGATTEFGAGTILAKFTKTPMNIIAFTTDHLGWDYATARREYKQDYKGLKKALPKPEAKKEALQMNQRELATSKAKALTGTTLIGTGMMLAALGGITPNKDDEDERLLLEAQGYKSGYLNMSGLVRNLLGGGGDKVVYDYNTGDIQDGDTLISINQLAPGGAFMLLGARIMDYLTAEEADKSFGNILAATLQGAIDSSTDLVDLPFNRTASMIINEFKYADYKEGGTTEAFINVGNKLLGSMVTSFIPAPVKQTSQLLDPYAKSYSRDSGEAVKEQIMANVPTLRDDVPYAFYVNGEPIQYSGEKNAIEALWSAYVAPYYKSVVKYDKPLKNITDSVAKNKVSPPTLAPNKITYSGSEYDLSKEERQEYQKAYWKTYEKTRDAKKASTSAKIDYFKRNKIKFELDKNGDLKKIK